MVMQYEEGYDLRRHLDRQKPYRLNENELKKLLMPLLDGLEAVHDLNYLHRDIKPSNIRSGRDCLPYNRYYMDPVLGALMTCIFFAPGFLSNSLFRYAGTPRASKIKGPSQSRCLSRFSS